DATQGFMLTISGGSPPCVASPTQPSGNLESPPATQLPNQGFTVGGWAIDKAANICTGVDLVHVYVYPADAEGNIAGSRVFFAQASYGGSRPDIAAAFGPQFQNSGFSTSVPGQPAGYYLVVAYAHSLLSNAWTPFSRIVQMAAPVSTPLMNIESPAAGNVPASFPVTAWAIDQGSTSGTGIDLVHVYVFPTDATGNVNGPYAFF